MSIKTFVASLGVAACVALPFSSTSAQVLDGAEVYNGHYYKAFEFKLPWDAASKFCQSMGGHLATMEDKTEVTVLDKIRTKGGGFNYWLGGYRDDQGLWRWLNGSIITDSFWRANEPSSSESKSKMLIHRYDKAFEWYSHDGNEKWSFICEWDSMQDAHESTM